MDFSSILVLPISAIVAFATVIVTFDRNGATPRLAWPWGCSTLMAVLVFLRLPDGSELILWIFTVFALSFQAALGTVIGGKVAQKIVRS